MSNVPPLTTPTSLTNSIMAFCTDLGPAPLTPQYVGVEPISGAETRDCFENAKLAVASSGGDVVYGWLIFELPSVYLEAHHHAVWRTPDGALIDVTPTEDGEKSVLFLEDSTRPYVAGKQERRRIWALSTDAAVRDLVEALDQLGRLEERCYVEDPHHGAAFAMSPAESKAHHGLRIRIGGLFQRVFKNVG